MKEKQYLSIDNIAIPLNLNDMEIVAPDILEAWNYYPNYLRHGGIKNPTRYLMEIFDQVYDTGSKRNKQLKLFSDYLGSMFRKLLEKYWFLYKQEEK
jgi:hypothetical protein